MVDAMTRHKELELSLAVADSNVIAKEAARDETAVQAAEAEAAFRMDQDKVDAVLQTRMTADMVVLNLSNSYSVAVAKASAANERHDARTKDVESAVNRTQQLTNDLSSARDVEAATIQALERTKVWQADFNASLLLERKEEDLQKAIDKESRCTAEEVRASKRESRMKTLLETHQNHLALIEVQVELHQKDKARADAKAAFDKSETDVKDAQAKLDGLVKTEAETHEKIGTTYQELEQLRAEHTEAQKAYDNQDPEERKRSFTTALER